MRSAIAVLLCAGAASQEYETANAALARRATADGSMPGHGRYVGMGRGELNPLGPLAEVVALRSRANFANLWFGGVALLKESRDFSLGKMLPAFRIA
jgi:hypothetical protein